MRLSLSHVIPNPGQPRKKFEPNALADLAASIVENGLLQPITVRRVAPDRYEIVAGERRWRAHQLAGLGEIEANVVDMDEAERDILAIVENLQRADITPLEEGRAFQKVLDTGVTVDELAKRLGLKQPWRITERTALLRLKPDVLDLFEKGHLTPSQATELARQTPPDQDRLLRMIRDGKCATYNKLRAASDALIQAASQSGFFDPPKTTEAELKVLTAFERKIEQIVRLIADGFTEGEVAILRKINPGRASVVAAQLAIIDQNLRQLNAELQKAIVRGQVAQGEPT